jgi:ribonuclease HII
MMRRRELHAGIDEAGYGPRLGPLCIGLAAFEVESEGDEPADLWRLLAAAVCKDHRDAKRGLIAVADSKALKGVGGASTDPLMHLERGVLAFEALASDGPTAESEGSLFTRLGVRVPASEWYSGDAPLPRSFTPDLARILRAQAEGACAEAGVRPRLVRCAAMDELTFNSRYTHVENKASVSFGVVGGVLRRLWEIARDEGLAARVAVDRQGGRAFYAPLLAEAVGAAVEPIEESETVSRYRVGGGAHDVEVEFRVEAESSRFAVALASMTAKFVRELFMARFNRYWCGRCDGLRPTAGYGTDAGRWIAEARQAGPRATVDSLVRRA